MDELRTQLQAVFARLEEVRMPFGKYGPKNVPPAGAPLYDLPYEYLSWFARQGFPKGELGQLLELVYQVKASGADGAFSLLRQRAGGRNPLRPPKRRHWDLSDD